MRFWKSAGLPVRAGALAVVAAALFTGAWAVRLAPSAPLVTGSGLEPSAEAEAIPSATPGATAPRSFRPPAPVMGGPVPGSLVERNPFDASRAAPAVRHTTTLAEERAAGVQDSEMDWGFALLGTVIDPGGRDIAVIRGDPRFRAGAAYRVGDEVVPGFRVGAITRSGATLVGNGQRLKLAIDRFAGAAERDSEM